MTFKFTVTAMSPVESAIAMARESGCEETFGVDSFSFTSEELVNLLNRVEEKERHACCLVVTGLCISDNNAEEINRAIRARKSK
jgi:pyridoxal/pyridoxine/pyridoxamine kinase